MPEAAVEQNVIYDFQAAAQNEWTGKYHFLHDGASQRRANRPRRTSDQVGDTAGEGTLMRLDYGGNLGLPRGHVHFHQ